jgi:hypothetical protein
MEHNEAVELLEQTLEEEKAADEKLTKLGEGGINEEAANAAGGDSDEEEGNEKVAPTPGKPLFAPTLRGKCCSCTSLGLLADAFSPISASVHLME